MRLFFIFNFLPQMLLQISNQVWMYNYQERNNHFAFSKEKTIQMDSSFNQENNFPQAGMPPIEDKHFQKFDQDFIMGANQQTAINFQENPELNHRQSKQEGNQIIVEEGSQKQIIIGQQDLGEKPKIQLGKGKSEIIQNQSTFKPQKTSEENFKTIHPLSHKVGEFESKKYEPEQDVQKISSQQWKKFQDFLSWHKFCLYFCFHPQVGYLVSPKAKLENKKFAQLKQIVSKLSKFQSSQQLANQIKKMDIIGPKDFKNDQEKIKFRDMLTYVEGKFLCLKKAENAAAKKSESEIIIPFPLSKFIIDMSKQLGIKVGPTAALSSNWRIAMPCQTQKEKQEQSMENEAKKQDPQLTMQNLQCLYFFTEYKKEQTIFFGTSIVASYYLTKVIQACFEINKIIPDEKISTDDKIKLILEAFKEMVQIWKLIYKLMEDLAKQLSPQVFFYHIRPHVTGFNNILFEGYNGVFSSGGGSAGEDPCYQIFEKAMGIIISEDFTKIQRKLREGMYQSHINMQDFFEANSLIKEYCHKNDFLLAGYQQVLNTYTKMNCFHNVFIKKFILAFIPQVQHNRCLGAGGNNIKDVMNRWKVLNEKNSLGMHQNKIENQDKKAETVTVQNNS